MDIRAAVLFFWSAVGGVLFQAVEAAFFLSNGGNSYFSRQRRC
ncbi:hypothetical protein LINPERPRIM_LOCUS33385 [Linum perenne]